LTLFNSMFLPLFLYHIVLGRVEYDLYMAYGDRKIQRTMVCVGFDVTKTIATFFFLAIPPLLLLIVLLADNYTAFTDQEIIENPFWSVGSRIVNKYTDVHGIYEVGSIPRRVEARGLPYQVIVFNNGTQ